ncbi:hypothetical protein OIU41_12515 [Lacticaseibacillus paracasei]|uniref:hypothetical protein n=1 Tax=Lacticaseibacillus paracasei TaxID=1597 RepID=UPI003398691D
MEMENIQKRSRNEIRGGRFFFESIVIPLFLPVLVGMIFSLVFSNERLLEFIGRVPVVGHILNNLVEIFPNLYNVAVYFCFYYLLGVGTHKFSARTQLLPDNHYFLIPTWMIKVAALVSHLHSGNASAIPIWQYAQYLYYRNSFFWRHLALLVPEVSVVAEGTEVERKIYPATGVNRRQQDRALIVEDTYPVDLNRLPNLLDEMTYVVLQTLSEGKTDRVRGYNSELVTAIVREVRSAESEGIRHLYLLLNTNPKHVSEVFREAFSDAGRNSLTHLYVFQSDEVQDYEFTEPHRIF